MAHTTGERSDLNWCTEGTAGSTDEPPSDVHIRQTFYSAFMCAMPSGCLPQFTSSQLRACRLKNGNEAMIAAQRSCREVASHPPWAPDTHSEIEAGDAFEAPALSPQGRKLYGYEVSRGERRAQREAASVPTVAADAGDREGGPDAAAALAKCGCTEVHCAFFRR